MLGAKRCSAFLLVCVTVLAGGSLAAAAQDAFDVGKLPRMPGGKEVFVHQTSTIYTTPATVPQTAEVVGRLLAGAGWQKYVAPFSAQSTDPSLQILSFKKAAQGLSVFITVAPAQANATSVSYTPVAIANDLPFPKGANDIAFDPSKPYLSCVSTDSVDTTAAFFTGELKAAGWKIWSAKEGATAAAVVEKADKGGAYGYYVRDGRQPLLMVLTREDDKTRVELKAVPASLLVAENKGGKPAPESSSNAPAKSSNAPPPPPQKSTADDMIEDMLKQAMQTARDAMAQAQPGAQPPARPPAAAPSSGGTEPPLRAAAASPAPIPVPEGADDVEYDGEDGKLEFSSASSVSSVAAFYRNAMKPLGFREQRSVINRSNMVVLNFTKSGKDITVTVMQMGNKANVTANGEALVTMAAKPGSPKAQAADASD